MTRTCFIGFALFAAFLETTACNEVHGNGHLEVQQRAVSGFRVIENRSALPVHVIQGPSFSVSVLIDSNLLGFVDTTVDGAVLRIDDSDDLDASSGSVVSVTLPAFDGFDSSGSGDATIDGVTQTGPVQLTCTGSGSIAFSGTAAGTSVTDNGSGSVRLSGTGRHLSAILTGSGSIDASALAANGGADLETMGSGSISAQVVGDATLRTTGSGSIDATLSGGAATFDVTGSGSITWSGDERVASVSDTGAGTVDHL